MVEDSNIYEKELDFFSKYLSIWVAICIIAGTAIGYYFPQLSDSIAEIEYANTSIPIAAVLLTMMYPIMLKIKFSELIRVRKNAKPLSFTLIVNWGIKPFTMALIAWIFMHFVFSDFISETLQNEYVVGMIILGLAPCTAMTLVWTYLARANLSCALIQVTINDLLILVLFAPTGMILLGLTAGFPIPLDTLFFSVLLYVAAPLGLAAITRQIIIKKKGEKWLERKFIANAERITPIGLLITLVLIFIFQGNTIVENPLHIALIAIPLLLQTYLIFAVGYFGTKKLRIPFSEAAPSAFIGASNFFELAVAVAIILFGVHSGVTLAVVVGVLVEVPVMLSLVKIMNAKKSKFEFGKTT
ncbi:ACR3 family arsenite efflux transporter [Nitrosopumilus sp.]|uniref:ACR3 family arsenite efflux transporter n=1 Tax=Nitrosopumilus sp. TaxID=2024843 RepID=UPI00349FEE90